MIDVAEMPDEDLVATLAACLVELEVRRPLPEPDGSERTWAVVLRGVMGSREEMPAAVSRAKLALGLPHAGAITIEQWLFDESTGRSRAEPLSPLRTPFPDFEVCHWCGRDAGAFVYWGGVDGWCCFGCGGSDADE